MENCPATIQEHPLGKKIHATAGMSTMNPTLATCCKPSYCPVIKWNAINCLCLCCNKSLGNLHHESSRWVCCLSAMLATYTQFLSKHTRFKSQRLRRLFGQDSNCWINQWQIYQWIKPTPSPVSHLQIWVHRDHHLQVASQTWPEDIHIQSLILVCCWHAIWSMVQPEALKMTEAQRTSGDWKTMIQCVKTNSTAVSFLEKREVAESEISGFLEPKKQRLQRPNHVCLRHAASHFGWRWQRRSKSHDS